MREFRARHAEFEAAGIRVAGVTLDTIESCATWARRLRLPYPLLSDTERRAGPAFHVLRRIGLGAWTMELFRRSTFLIDGGAVVRAVWGDVKIRGHARDVLEAARALPAQSSSPGGALPSREAS